MIIITGASRSIGKYLFEKYSAIETVYGTFLTTPQNQSIHLEKMFKVDIADFDSVHQFYTQIEPSLSKITLINCAGISYNSFAHKSDPAEWKKIIDTNLTGTYNIIRVLLPIMREQGYGRIINFSSVVASLPTPGISAYAASKAGLLGLTKSLAAENASKGITVNAINLGYANIGMGVNDVPLNYQEKMKTQIPAGRFCEPEEIYNTVNYLIQTEYVNGSCIDINGALI